MHSRVIPSRLGNGPIPVAPGIGLKPQHISEILQHQADIGWFEVHPENYLMDGGPMHKGLMAIRERYPLSFHSVGMSLGSAQGIDRNHIQKLKHLIDRYQPAMVSDHLSWTRIGNTSLNDLLPLPYTQEALQVFCSNVAAVQELLGRTIALENPSSYFTVAGSEMDECDFLVETARRTGASILLDINNIFVSAANHGWSALDYLHRIPPWQVSEMHLAGHTVELTMDGPICIDDHGSQVSDDVWALYAKALEHVGRRPTLIEWDTRVPSFSVLQEQAKLAARLMYPKGFDEERLHA